MLLSLPPLFGVWIELPVGNRNARAFSRALFGPSFPFSAGVGKVNREKRWMGKTMDGENDGRRNDEKGGVPV